MGPSGRCDQRASAATTLYRRSQIARPEPWLDPQTDQQAAAGNMRRPCATRSAVQAYLFVPRIPGDEKYLAALDAAVHEAVRGEKSPADALSRRPSQWSKITDELGLDAQRKRLSLEPGPGAVSAAAQGQRCTRGDGTWFA